MKLCHVSGCGAPAASSFSSYCSRHKANLRRHGSPNQRGITKSDVSPYLGMVKARIEKNPHSPAWTVLDNRWRALVDKAMTVASRYERGLAGNRVERKAAYEILNLAGDVCPRAVVEMTMAMVMMRELKPQLFASDQAFWVQLSRRVRGLTDLNFGERYDHANQRTKRCYRELSPRSAVVLGRWLAQSLGIGGLHLARLEQGDLEEQREERQKLHDALAQLA